MFSFTRNASSSFIGRMSPAHVQLLKAALLDGDAAIAAYREWRQDLDFYSLSYGQQRILPLLQRNLTRLGVADPLTNRFRGNPSLFLGPEPEGDDIRRAGVRRPGPSRRAIYRAQGGRARRLLLSRSQSSPDDRCRRSRTRGTAGRCRRDLGEGQTYFRNTRRQTN